MVIDSNIVDLVDSLNAFPGIFTFSSCGGHANPTIVSQRPLGAFYVNFVVDPLRGGWRSLQLISHVVGNSTAELELTVWQSGDEPESMTFGLTGSEGADASELASALENVLDWFNSNPPFVFDESNDNEGDEPEATRRNTPETSG